jgi:uncharacterized protein
MIRKIGLMFCLIVGSGIGQAQKVYTVETVPNTKVANDSYISDPEHLLRDSTVMRINTLLRGLENQTTVQVAVVMLPSVGEEQDFDFAQKLFERWGIGHAAKDNGLLILFIQDQKKIRFHTGFGVEGTLPDVICKRIEMQHMVPFFKLGNVDDGMLGGIRECIKILTNPAYAEELRDESTAVKILPSVESSMDTGYTMVAIIMAIGWLLIGLIIFAWKKKSGFTDSIDVPAVPSTKVSSKQWLWWFLIVPILLIVVLSFAQDALIFWGGIYIYLLILLIARRVRMDRETKTWFEKGEYHSLYNLYDDDQLYWRLAAVFFPIPFALLIGAYGQKKESFRTHPRACKNCGKPAIRLSEDTEDAYLKKSQTFEEELKTADYDVWKCEGCGATQIYKYRNKQTKYKECPSCATLAYTTLSSTTVSAATTTSEGMKEIRKACKFCGHQDITSVVIPMISSSSSSDSGSSSSSDSGGSYGGGDSGGGGASSSW